MKFLQANEFKEPSILVHDPALLKAVLYDIIAKEGSKFGVTLTILKNNDVKFFEEKIAEQQKFIEEILQKNKGIDENIFSRGKATESYEKCQKTIDMLNKAIEYKIQESQLAEKT